MRRSLLVPTVVALLGLTASAAFADPLVSHTALTIHRRPPGQVSAGDTITIEGRLVGRPECRGFQEISLLLVGDGVVATTTTSASGAYSFTTTISATTSFQTRFDGATIGTHPNERLCAASISPVLRVKVAGASVLGESGSANGRGPAAFTGWDTAKIALIVAILLALGALALMATRRRRA